MSQGSFYALLALCLVVPIALGLVISGPPEIRQGLGALLRALEAGLRLVAYVAVAVVVIFYLVRLVRLAWG